MVDPRRWLPLTWLLGACTPALEASPHDFDGSCAGARPLDPLTSYDLELRTQPGEGGFIRVRADASWPAENLQNVLGRLEGSRRLRGSGPLKGTPSAGVGYAVPLRDRDGQTCRGYVSHTVVEVVTGAYDSSP